MLKRLVFFAWLSAVFAGTGEAEDEQAKVQEHVARAVQPGMERHGTPGMAVAIVINGQSYVFNYGLASKESGTPVGNHTLFEIGSITKTFTATLTSYAQVTGRLSLSDHVSKYFPALQGSRFGEVTLLNLGTHTPGGLPLQVPNDVTNDDQLIDYFKNWQPTYAPGTYRTYSNPGIGFLGVIAAKSLNDDFAALMERKVFPPLGLKNTYVNVPSA